MSRLLVCLYPIGREDALADVYLSDQGIIPSGIRLPMEAVRT